MKKAAEYAEYVSGRTIAAVGRARPLFDQSKEIASNDLIMVTSYAGESVPWYYSKCDISVFNRGHCRMLLENPELSGSLRLDWALFRTPKFQPSGQFESRVVGGPVFFDGLGNQIPIFLNDIAKFAPARVTIYGTDLYLSGYDTERPNGLKFGIEKQIENLLKHDQPKTRRYYQLMCELYPFIVPDARLDSVLGMSDKQFWSELSDAWGGL